MATKFTLDLESVLSHCVWREWSAVVHCLLSHDQTWFILVGMDTCFSRIKMIFPQIFEAFFPFRIQANRSEIWWQSGFLCRYLIFSYLFLFRKHLDFLFRKPQSETAKGYFQVWMIFPLPYLTLYYQSEGSNILSLGSFSEFYSLFPYVLFPLSYYICHGLNFFAF